jgi:rod shape-determining protein MreD
LLFSRLNEKHAIATGETAMPFSSIKKRKYLRRALLAVLVFFVAMAQSVPWLPAVFGLHAFPLLPLVVSIAVLDQTVPAIFFGAGAGLLWDLNHDGFGWHALLLTVVAFVCAILLRYVLNRNWLTVSLLLLLFESIYFALRWLEQFAARPDALAGLLQVVLPEFAYTAVLSPLCYWLVWGVVRRTARRQKGVLSS